MAVYPVLTNYWHRPYIFTSPEFWHRALVATEGTYLQLALLICYMYLLLLLDGGSRENWVFVSYGVTRMALLAQMLVHPGQPYLQCRIGSIHLQDR